MFSSHPASRRLEQLSAVQRSTSGDLAIRVYGVFMGALKLLVYLLLAIAGWGVALVIGALV